MTDETFKIFVEQLRDGHTEIINEAYPPAFMNVQEKELDFDENVIATGEAYLANENLILHLQLHTQAKIPCTICNTLVKIPVEVEEFYTSIPLEEIKSGIFNCKELIREAILLETPQFAECNEGQCPQRKEIQKYLSKEDPTSSEEHGYHPFADLE